MVDEPKKRSYTGRAHLGDVVVRIFGCIPDAVAEFSDLRINVP
jgi:hypothetical protein